ncbi:uncharacterized protein LOC115779895 [Archocentrus centrarchus]|uniref:uncharacterized protein LOC115779895 n=1 Tax=Archocentrus centrarchus TaxID=63155 RepID=UPI0011EA4101|nr:uncharacterized protein LOC115779895 [Archocentrus centrarchus]
MALGGSQIERALGIKWCVVSDQFHFRVIVDERPLSRRGVLSTVASIYDPLGFVAPFILVGKQILQEMCQDKIGWDEPLSEDLKPRWESWLLDLKNLADVKIQRCYLPEGFEKVERYELHHFSDASVKGYGECSYLRAISVSNQVSCSLVIGKARVTPTKITTIPRLELSAAVIAVRTSDLLKRELEVQAQEFFWTDSKVVLGYINNNARRFHIFVANRIQRIQEGSDPDQWRYVSSEDNPADHASRGLTAKGLITSNWLTGPDFLWHDKLPAYEVKVGDLGAEDPELRSTFVHKTLATEDSLLNHFSRFSSWTRLVKAIARLMRCVKEVKGLVSRTNEVTSLEERKEAELFIISTVQKEVFSEEIKDLKSKKQITRDSTNRLRKLNPFLDEMGVLRVGELLDDMTSDAFINALRTLIAIRGNVRQLRSDQGTNFAGAKREFLESPYGWSLGKADQDDKECADVHPGSFVQKT